MAVRRGLDLISVGGGRRSQNGGLATLKFRRRRTMAGLLLVEEVIR